MSLHDWLQNGRLQYATLWALALTCVGFALADTPLLGFEPSTLAMLGTVFAATTAVYKRRSGCAPNPGVGSS